MNILVLGGGGREHAIAWALAKSPRTDSLYVAPGNGGTDGIAQNVPDLNPEDGQAVLAFVRENAIDFVVIGPEAPWLRVLPTCCAPRGFPRSDRTPRVPSWKAARRFQQEIHGRQRHPHRSLRQLHRPRACACLRARAGRAHRGEGRRPGRWQGRRGRPTNLRTRKTSVRSCFDGAFGDSGKTVLIEECLTGPECSMLAFVSDGKAPLHGHRPGPQTRVRRRSRSEHGRPWARTRRCPS